MSTTQGNAVMVLSTLVALLQTICTQIKLNSLMRNPSASFLDINNITADNLSHAKPAVQQRHPGD